MVRADVLIVGAGHGGAHAAIALRKAGFKGSLMIIDGDSSLPYERPPLSKDYLSGERSEERLLVRPESFWQSQDIRIVVGQRVNTILPGTSTVRLASEQEVSFGELIWAGGGVPRRLNCPGNTLCAIHYVRTRHDVRGLRADLADARRVVIIGAGYIGLECAATLAKSGKHITVLEAGNRILGRVCGVVVSSFLEAEHRRHGIDIRLADQVESIQPGVATRLIVRCQSGDCLAADLVIVGIGIIPSVTPLLAAGAAGGNGVKVDSHCRTSLPGISAIGDCALHSNVFADGQWLRLESVQNAIEMAGVVAAAQTGNPRHYVSVPWFWSTQFDNRIQTAGLLAGHDSTQLTGDVGGCRFSVRYLRRGRLIAAECINSPREFMAVKNELGRLYDAR
jgi:3-phenylpropionate/trans-cinnamate dioxygenase ferredoxin reductase component